jgi:hypothetical protein
MEDRVRKSLVIVFAASLVASVPAFADPIAAGDIVQLRLTNNNGSTIARFSDGGPFRLDLAGTANDFLTFCLEIDEYFTPGENLRVGSISNQALNGGINTNSGDFISGTTAYMYSRFRDGDANFSNGVLLQEAIWYLENERTTASSAALGLISQAQAQMQTIGWGANDIGAVRVLNLYRGTGYTTYAQDMLTIASVPEPGTMLLVGLGLGIAARARARRRLTACPVGVSGK